MKKSHRFTYNDSDNSDQENSYWDQNLSEEDVTYNPPKKDFKKSRLNEKRKKSQKPIRKIDEEDYALD